MPSSSSSVATVVPRGSLFCVCVVWMMMTVLSDAFSFDATTTKPPSSSVSKTLLAKASGGRIQDDDDETSRAFGRRSFLASAASAAASMTLASASAPPPALAVQEAEYRQGIKVDAFNGLIFNYRGGDFGGLRSSDLDGEEKEDSVSYAEFNRRLSAGEVEYVEFLAPDGDRAYVTFKKKGGGDGADSDAKRPVRIGEGYPVERHDGYSSPLFCVRAVKDAGVPYRFVVPSLSKYSSSSS